MSHKILEDKSVPYHLDRASELLAEYSQHRDPKMLSNAVKQIAYVYAKECADHAGTV